MVSQGGSMAGNRYLLFATGCYALPILQPLADALQAASQRAHALLLDGAS